MFHFNHQIRKESEEEENFIIKVAQKLDLPLYIDTLNIPKIAKKLKKNLEETARIFRYRSLFRLANKIQNSIVLTGHNADDYIETVLLRLLRGSHFRNTLFWQKRNIILKISKKTHSLTIYSPLLLFEKTEILKYLDQNQIPYLIDYSNFDTKLKRNYIRHKILLALKKIGFSSSLVWQRTHLQSKFFTEKESNLRDFITIDQFLFENLSNLEIKILFDQITKKIGIFPIQKEIIFEFIRQSSSNRIYIESKECIICSSKNKIWFIRKNSPLLKKPVIIIQKDFSIIEWNNQKRIYKNVFQIHFLEMENNLSIKKKIKESLREKSIPEVIRNHIPYIILEKNFKILLSFIEGFWDLII